MSASYDKNTALVVMPPIGGGRLTDRSLRTWLAQASLTPYPTPLEPLRSVLDELGRDYPEDGLAALRMWGQTGDRPTNWIAAADPVYLEPQLDSLCLHALRRRGVPATELRAVVDHLQKTLGTDGGLGFIRLGSYGYVSSKSPFVTAEVPAFAVDLKDPADFLPSGENTALHRNVLSEVEMALHEHPTNVQRESQGLQPINSLWLWGGGTAPEPAARPQPPLFSDDALLTGYWYSGKGVAEPWLDSITKCLEIAVNGFVAEAPEFLDNPSLVERWLNELRDALHAKRLSTVILLFRDGLRAEIHRSDSRRFWRRDSKLLD